MKSSIKKGQINQVFIYIMAVIIFAAIMLYGYKAIKNIMEKGNYVEYTNFKKDFENTVENSKQYGEVNIKSFSLPPGVSEICIVDIKEPVDTTAPMLVQDAWQSKTYNVVLLPIKYDNLFVEGIKIDTPGFLCNHTSAVRSKITLRFEGSGNAVRIS